LHFGQLRRGSWVTPGLFGHDLYSPEKSRGLAKNRPCATGSPQLFYLVSWRNAYEEKRLLPSRTRASPAAWGSVGRAPSTVKIHVQMDFTFPITTNRALGTDLVNRQ
jgi:hypothetical protein